MQDYAQPRGGLDPRCEIRIPRVAGKRKGHGIADTKMKGQFLHLPGSALEARVGAASLEVQDTVGGRRFLHAGDVGGKVPCSVVRRLVTVGKAGQKHRHDERSQCNSRVLSGMNAT